MSHTQTKLRVGEKYKANIYADRAGHAIARTVNPQTEGECEANARRLVASWNACIDQSTENLEADFDQGYSPWAHVAELEAQRDELLEALKIALQFMEQKGTINGYGFYRPKNPHNFHPAPESCTAEEMANHKAACEAYDAGNYRDDYGGGWISPKIHVTTAPWGFGSYTEIIPEIEADCAKARAAIKKAEGKA